MRIPISSNPVNEQDDVRRKFIEMKACRPRLSKNEFPQTLIGKKKRRFNILWYDSYDWLEYSVQNDTVFCFYCFLFKDATKCPEGDTFVKGGWKNWDNAMTLVELTKKHLQNTRDYEWDNFLQSVCDFCAKHNIDVPRMHEPYVPRGRSRRFFDMKTNLHQFRIDMFISVIDKQLLKLNDRFNKVNTELLLCMACLSPVNLFASFDKQKLMRLDEFYPNEFSSSDKSILAFELDTYVNDMKQDSRFQQVKNLDDLSILLVETNKHVCYPRVYLLLKFVFILPVATAFIERIFYAMTYVENKLRNSMGNSLLNHCLVTFIEKEFFVQVKDDDVLKRFQNMKSRRMIVDI